MSHPAAGLDIGRSLVEPTLAAWGTDDQRARFLPDIEAHTEQWCQLFSEPGAGSDLAGLATRAVPCDGGWLVSGQKVWSTLAHVADRGLLLARTDPEVPKHAGITCFALDMRQPGVSVRPLRQMTGRSDEFNEVFLDDAFVADDDRIGPCGAGWKVSQTTLTSERAMLAGTPRSTMSRGEQLVAAARASGAWEDPLVRQRLIDLVVHKRVIRLTNRRVADAVRRGHILRAAAATKLARSVLARRLEDTALLLHGATATAWDDSDSPGVLGANRFLHAQCETIIGGTSDIQRTIVGDRALGLPREPAVDRDRPWSQTVR